MPATLVQAAEADTQGVVLVQSCARGRLARRMARQAQEAQGDVENPDVELSRATLGSMVRCAKDNGQVVEERRRAKTVEELEYEREGGFSRVRQEEAIRSWTCVLW
jgi:DNA repair photolyase